MKTTRVRKLSEEELKSHNEYELFKRLITETYPSGIVSIVSDTFDLWNVLSNIIPQLRDEILARDGKVVVRPDSGLPEDILCGDINSNNFAAKKGVVELLWDIFGGTVNSKGYKELDPHIGAIYGDSITFERAGHISQRLADKGFASTNIVYGIGSYTYQYVTRDTFGFAIKATYGIVNGEPREIFKDPITDDGTKKSLKGLLAVGFNYHSGRLAVSDQVTPDVEENHNLLLPTYVDGVCVSTVSLATVRKTLGNI